MGTIRGSVFRDAFAANFNGTDEYAYVDDPTFKANTQGCFAFWYRPATVLSASGVRSVLSFGTTSGANNSRVGLIQRYNGSAFINATYRRQPIPDVTCRITHNGTVNSGYGNHIFTAATTVLWIWQSNGTAWQHGINGSLITTTAWQSGGTNTGDWLGDMSGTNHRLAFGTLWEANAASLYSNHRHNECIYINRPLTAGEVTELYHAGVTRNPNRFSFRSDIQSWWRFGDSRDTGSTIYDEIGSNNLTTVNMDATNYGTP